MTQITIADYRRLSENALAQASRDYVNLVYENFAEKKKKKIANMDGVTTETNVSVNVKYTFKKELDMFCSIFPNLVKIASLTEEMRSMNDNQKKFARAQKAVLKEKNDTISDKDFDKYFTKYHRVINGKVYRVIDKTCKPKKGKKTKTKTKKKYSSILKEVDEKDRLLMVPVEDSFEILRGILDNQELIGNRRSIHGRPLCQLFDKQKLHYGVTIPMCDMFVVAIAKACRDSLVSSESSAGGSEESSVNLDPDGGDSSSGRNADELKQPSYKEVEIKVPKEAGENLFESDDDEENEVTGPMTGDGVVAEVDEEMKSVPADDEMNSVSSQTSVGQQALDRSGTVLVLKPNEDTQLVGLMKQPLFSPEVEGRNMTYTDGSQDIDPSLDYKIEYLPDMGDEALVTASSTAMNNSAINNWDYKPIVAQHVVEMESENSEEKLKRDTYENLLKSSIFFEEQKVAARNEVNSKMMLGDPQQKHFSHIMIQVFTFQFEISDKNEHHHVLAVYDLLSSFIVFRDMTFPYDCGEVGEHLSQIFGDFGYPLTVSYYGNGICFTESRYYNDEKEPVRNGFGFDSSDFGSGKYSSVENDVLERVMCIHETIFKGNMCVFDETRSILCNVLHPTQLECEMDLRVAQFLKRVEYYDTEVSEVSLLSGRSPRSVISCYPQAQYWVNTEGHIYQGPIDECDFPTKYENRSSFEKQFGRCAFYNEFDPVIVGCTNFYTDCWSTNNPALGFTRSRNESDVQPKVIDFFCSESVEKFGYPPCMSPYGMAPNISRLALDQNTDLCERLDKYASRRKFPVGIQNLNNKCAFNSAFRFLQDMPQYNSIINGIIKELVHTHVMNSELTYPLLWSYVLCGRMLYNVKQAGVSLNTNDHFIGIEPFVECLFRRMEGDIEIEQDVDNFVDRDGNEDVTNIVNKFFDICSTDVHEHNTENGNLLVSLFKPSSKYVLNCTQCNEVWERKLNKSEEPWAMQLSIREELPNQVSNLIMTTAGIGDCLIHLEDLMRIESSSWNEVLEGSRCRYGDMRFKKDQKWICNCAVKKKTVYEAPPPYLIIDMNRYTRKDSRDGTYVPVLLKLKVFIPQELKFEFKKGQENCSTKYYLKTAIAHEGNSLNKGHYVVLKECPGPRYLRISDKVTTEITQELYRNQLFQDGTLFLFRRNDVDAEERHDSAVFNEYEFTPEVMKFKEQIELMSEKNSSMPKRAGEANVEDSLKRGGQSIIETPKLVQTSAQEGKSNSKLVQSTIQVEDSSKTDDQSIIETPKSAQTSVHANSKLVQSTIQVNHSSRTGTDVESIVRVRQSTNETPKSAQRSAQRDNPERKHVQSNFPKKHLIPDNSLVPLDTVHEESDSNVPKPMFNKISDHNTKPKISLVLRMNTKGKEGMRPSKETKKRGGTIVKEKMKPSMETKKRGYTIAHPDVPKRQKISLEIPDVVIGNWLYDDDTIKFTANTGIIDYFEWSSKRPHQWCLFCGELTHLKFGKFSYICGKCSPINMSDNSIKSVVSRRWMKKQNSNYEKLRNKESSSCFGCFKELKVGRQDSVFHPLGELKFCRKCVIQGECKCVMCGPKDSFLFTNQASFLKKKHSEQWDKWIDGLKRSDVEEHKSIMKNGINNHVSRDLNSIEKELLEKAKTHDKEFIMACNYNVLRTTDFQTIVFNDNLESDPMTVHFMKFFVELCESIHISDTNSVRVEYNCSDPSVLLKHGLDMMFMDERIIYVGIENNVWFAHEIAYPKAYKKSLRMIFFGRKYDDFHEKMSTVMEDYYLGKDIADDDQKCVHTSVNHAKYFGSQSLNEKRDATRNKWGSVYCMYFIINRLAGMDVAIHDSTMQKLRQHLGVAILTGEPLYYLDEEDSKTD